MSIKENLIGQKFGLLTVIKEAERSKDNRVQWLCKCDCGKEKTVRGKHLKNKQIISCGCYFKNNVKTFKKKNYDTKSKEYQLWNKTSKDRCKEWNDFNNFYNWLISNNYNSHSLYKKDKNVNYNPENCFLVKKEDTGKGSLNGNSIIYEIDGTTKSIRGWANDYNIQDRIVYSRLKNELPLEICLLPITLYKKAKKDYLQDKNKKDFYNPTFKQDFNIENEKSGIYCIENTVNNKVYIGSSYNIGARWKQHLYALKNNKHHSRYLQNSWNKYGSGNFIFKVIEYCEIELLLKKEQEIINKNNSNNIAYGYNLCAVAGSPLGHKHSNEAKAKMREKSSWKKPIIQYDINGIFIRRWNSASEAHDEGGFSQTCIRKVCLGINSHHKNYIWKYELAAPGEESTSKYTKAVEVNTPIIHTLEELEGIL